MHTITRITITSCCLLMALVSAAQDSFTIAGNTATYTQQADEIFENLNKERIPYGILYDRVFPCARLYDSTAYDTSGLEYFIQAYSEWQRAAFTYEHIDSIFDHTSIRDFVFEQNSLDSIPVLVFNADFGYLDSLALGDGRIDTVDGLVYDGSNPNLPYLTHHAAFAILGLHTELDSGKTYYFTWYPYYQFGNHADAVKSIDLQDLSTGAIYTLSADAPVAAVICSETGLRNFKITLNFTEQAHAPFTIVPNIEVRDAGYPTGVEGTWGTITADIGYRAEGDTESRKGKIEYLIKYGKVDGTPRGYLYKPIIMLDGFDPGNARDRSNIFEIMLKYKSANGADKHLGRELIDDGYDVVIVDFPVEKLGTKIVYIDYKIPPNTIIKVPRTTASTIDHGAGYIQRNGFSLVSMINYVNSMMLQYSSPHQLVVVGPSMGGQISRFALKYMEDKNWNHNTRLWISFDSPHLGANIPLSMQSLLQWLTQSIGDEGAKNTYNNTLRSPAARQMLIHQTNQNYPFHMFANNTEPLRMDWINTLNTMGYPSNLRKVSIANGAYTGGYIHPLCTSMFTLKGYGMNLALDVLEAKPYFMGSSACTLLTINYVHPFSKDYHITLVGTSATTNGSIDATPGGLFDVQGEFKSSATTKKSPYFNLERAFVDDETQNICFIPTPSALAMYDPNFPWVNALSPVDMHCNSETPFDNIYTPAENEPHVKLTADNVDWIKQELAKGDIPCPKVCVWGIDGDDHIIINQSKTYSLIGGIPGNATTVWHPGPGLSQSSATNTNVVITSNIGAGNTYVDVQIITPCQPDVRYRKQISTSYFKQANNENKDEKSDGSIKNITSAGIYIYPNPATDYWNIDVTQPAQNISASLTDISGRQVWFSSNTAPHIFHIGSQAFAPGLYTLRLNIDGKETFHKLIK